MNQEIDNLIRDITRAGFMPKSEARRRIKELLKAQKKEIVRMIERKEPFVALTKDWAERKKVEMELKKYKRDILKVIDNL